MESFAGELGFMATSAGKAFLIMMEPHRLMFLALGCIMGLVLGIVPGIGGLAGTAMLLPFTFTMDPYSAFALLLGLGATTATGDPIPAVLFGVPGGAASAATVLDGFPMAKRGEAGRALSAAYMSSLMGGIFGAMLLAISIPILRPVMLFIGSPELLAFSILGISMVAVLSGNAPLRGLTAGCFGVMIAMIGTDPQTGTLRWTMDSLYLWDGLPIVPLLLGVFALPELCDLLIGRVAISSDTSKANIYKGQWQGVKDCFQNWWLILRCSWIGGGIGSIPGISASVVDWLAYGHALKTEKGASQTFGKGDVRGVIASESSNNAKEGGALVPTIAFGVPGSATMAILLGAFLIHGLVPGPDMLTKNLSITYSMVWSVALANILGAGLCYAFSPQFAKIATLALHAHSPGRARHRLYRRVRSQPAVGRPDHAAVLRPGRLDHEAGQVAAAAAHSRRGAGRHHRALHVHLDRALSAVVAAASGGGRAADSGHHRPGAAAAAGYSPPRRPGADADQLPGPAIPSRAAVHRLHDRGDRLGGRGGAALGLQRQGGAVGGGDGGPDRGGTEPAQRHVPQAGGRGGGQDWRARSSTRWSSGSTWISPPTPATCRRARSSCGPAGSSAISSASWR